MKEIILASGSARRKKLLRQVISDFKVEPSNFDEESVFDLGPHELVEFLSRRKAAAVAENTKNAIIIGADTIVVLDGQVYGKPKNKEEARQTLGKLSGREHSVISGVTVIDMTSGRVITRSVETKVIFNDLTPEQIENYIATGYSLDRAGSYSVEDLPPGFLRKIEGDFDNVVGLPLSEVKEILTSLNLEI